MLRTALLSFFFLIGKPAQAAEPTYHCTDAEGAKYFLSLEAEPRSLTLESSLGRREWKLTPPNLERALAPGSPAYYVAVSPKGKTEYTRLQMGTLVRTHLFQHEGRPAQSVDLTLDYAQLTKLTCQSTKYPLPFVPVWAGLDAPSRFSEPARFFGGRIDSEGALDPISLLALETSLLEFLRWPGSSEKAQFDVFAKLMEPALLKSPPSALETLRGRLTKKEKEQLERLLEAVRYRYHPETTRLSGWVTEGIKKDDWDQVKGGLRAFFRSDSFSAADLKKRFESEVKKSLSSLGPFEIAGLTEGRPAPEVEFVVGLWDPKRGEEVAALRSTYPLLRELDRSLTPQKFPEFVAVFSKLIRHPDAPKPGVREYLKTTLLPRLDRLPKKDQGKLLSLLPESEKLSLQNLREPPPGP
jgi:hypothetical protein